ncbi:cytochrome P450 [Streptomyces eurocidicus]|uniref:Sterol 14-demethylase n=1 Tax=Streptomyces eurocidicus TaxID=66423 RepID=A0A7W8B9X8_STREU|nr:cytochrome P450 [Streptomyces eurocidicus]MBB5118962.1 sterol 14-demethylase [Streptomyces eurocidicus]
MSADSSPAPPPRLTGGGLPWIGHAVPFSRDPVAFLTGARERAGDAFSFTLLGRPTAFLCGRAAHEAVFRADEQVLSPRAAYRFMTPVFGPGVAYDAEPAEMERQIGHLLPALTSRALAAHACVMEEVAEAHVRGWGESGERDLMETMNELTVSISTRCLLGVEVSRRLGPELPGLFRDLESGVRLAGLLSPSVPLPAFRRRDRARAALGRVLGEVISARRAARPADEGPQDMLATLLSARSSTGEALADETVIGLLIGMIFAGQHTSAVLAAWTGVLLLNHPEHIPALLCEQERAMEGHKAVTAALLRRMEHLEHCVREAERLHPPLVLLIRRALRDFDHAGRRIPAGTLVMISPAVSHRLPDVFRDPDRFDPGRYAPGREEHTVPYALIGFGGGKHRCVGLAFAYQQVKIIWSVLLRGFELRLGRPGPCVPDYSTFVPGPRTPCPIRYRRRTPPHGPGSGAGQP